MHIYFSKHKMEFIKKTFVLSQNVVKHLKWFWCFIVPAQIRRRRRQTNTNKWMATKVSTDGNIKSVGDAIGVCQLLKSHSGILCHATTTTPTRKTSHSIRFFVWVQIFNDSIFCSTISTVYKHNFLFEYEVYFLVASPSSKHACRTKKNRNDSNLR